MKRYMKYILALSLFLVCAMLPMTADAGKNACTESTCPEHGTYHVACPSFDSSRDSNYCTDTSCPYNNPSRTDHPNCVNTWRQKYARNKGGYGTVYDHHTKRWTTWSQNATTPVGKFYVEAKCYNHLKNVISGSTETYPIKCAVNKNVRYHTHYRLTYSYAGSSKITGSTAIRSISGLNATKSSVDLWTNYDPHDPAYKTIDDSACFEAEAHGTREFVYPVHIKAKKVGFYVGASRDKGSQIVESDTATSESEVVYSVDTNSCGVTNHGTFACAHGGAYEIGVMSVCLYPIDYYILFDKGLTDDNTDSHNLDKINLFYTESGDLSENKWKGTHYTLTFDVQSGVMPSGFNADNWKGRLKYANKWHCLTNNNDYAETASVKGLSATQAGKVKMQAVWNDKELTNFPTPIRDGYVFDGWYTAATGGTKVTSVTFTPNTEPQTKTLYAHWKPKYTTKYAIGIPNTCSTNNADDGASVATVTETDKVSGTKYPYWTPDWVLHGYHYQYQKWYNYNYYSVLAGETLSEHGAFGYNGYVNTPANAGWTYWNYAYVVPNGYTVKYDKNKPEGKFDVEGTVADQSCTFDTWFNLRSSGYTCPGYDLVGWSKIPGDYDTQMKAGELITTDYDFRGVVPDRACKLGLKVRNCAGWSKNNDSVTLYAVWKPIPYEVYYTKGTSGTISRTYGIPVCVECDYSRTYNLFNNTPNLPNTKEDGEPHFKSQGYYILRWRVKSITGTRIESEDTTNAFYNTNTGYDGETAISDYSEFKNLCTPTKHDCSVTLEAVWEPIQYKVLYNNDTTIPDRGTVDRGYNFSTETRLSKVNEFGKSYKVEPFACTRSNKYGPSTFLGYCFEEGDIYKKPNYVVESMSPTAYLSDTTSGYKREYTATDFRYNATRVDQSLVSHKEQFASNGVSWNAYFDYLNEGDVQSFNLYAVWDDCPGMEPIDTEQLRGSTAHDASTNTPGMGRLTRSGTDLEYKILMLPVNKGSVWDREDPVSNFTSPDKMKDHYYLDNLNLLEIEKNPESVTSYELRYTLVDDNGNRYQTSRLIYSGFFKDIMLHDVNAFEHY